MSLGGWLTPLGGFVLGLLVLAPGRAHGRCGDDVGDAAAVAAARAQIDRDCPCASAANHIAYLRCAVRVASARVNAVPALLPRRCRAAVKKCAARSTCGRSGTAVCRVTGNCRIVSGAAKCAERGGTVEPCPSCCDACSGSTSTTTTTLRPVCGGLVGIPCPDGSFCELSAGHCCCDFQGTCVALPSPCFCPERFDPVCGCDGQTYGNDCERRCAAVSKDHDGFCR